MKRLTILIILALMLSSLFGCSNFGIDSNDETNRNKMVAKIVAIGEKIEVNVIEDEYGASGIYWVNFSDATRFETDNGDRISIEDLEVGDKIAIIYNGQVMMSYPPQIVAKEITKLS